jgi:hypothetical protein
MIFVFRIVNFLWYDSIDVDVLQNVDDETHTTLYLRFQLFNQ